MADPREVARFEWRIGEVGDPAQLLQDFLVSHGIPADDLTALTVYNGEKKCDRRLPLAALLVSAAGATAMMTTPRWDHFARITPATPAPEVPDVVAIVFESAGFESTTEPSADFRQPSLTEDLSIADRFTIGDWERSWSASAHRHAIDAVRSAIAAGEIYQANVVGHQSAPFSGNPAAVLRNIGDLPGGRYRHVLRGKDWAVATASPECLVTVTGGEVSSQPIKGTRARTAAGRVELLRSAKERAEHIMIVDLVRNDLAQVAAVGSVRVTDLFTPQPWCDLWQAESTITATLREGADLAALLRAIAPAGSVTGAPKLAALNLINSVEPVGRGPSMGAIGWISPARLDLGVTIRTVAAAGGRLHLWTGGGITWSSHPDSEIAEAEAKAKPLKSVLWQAAEQPVHIM